MIQNYCKISFAKDCMDVQHGTITNDPRVIRDVRSQNTLASGVSQIDTIYLQGTYANLTCHSGYVLNHYIFLKSALVICNYTPEDGSAWHLLGTRETMINQTAECIRGRKMSSELFIGLFYYNLIVVLKYQL